MNEENSPADLAIRALRVKVLLDEVPKTDIAKSTGIGRSTVTKRLKSKDISLNEYVAISQYVGIDPLKLLGESIEKSKSATSKLPHHNAALFVGND